MRQIFIAFISIAFHFSLKAGWKESQIFFWFNSTTPAVAVTSSNIVNIEHATGSVTGVQIGNPIGIDTNLCTGFVTDGVCGGSIADCQWGRNYKLETNDVYLFHTCRPVTSGIAYVNTNGIVSMPIVWYSAARLQWFTGFITHVEPIVLETFGSGEQALYGQYWIDGTLAIAGDSGSPMFDTQGNFMGCVAATAGGPALPNFVYFLFPLNVMARPPTGGAAGLGALFNSDPDR